MTTLGHVATIQSSAVDAGVVVEVHSSHGVPGRAFAAGVPGALRAAVERSGRDHVIGSDLDSIEGIRRRMVPYVGFDGTGAEAVGIAAVENALWDCYARTLGVILCSALGGSARDSVLLVPQLRRTDPPAALAGPGTGPRTAVHVRQPAAGSKPVSPSSDVETSTLIIDLSTQAADRRPRTEDQVRTALDCTGTTMPEIHRWLALDDTQRVDLLFASVAQAGVNWMRSLAILAELNGLPLLIDGRGHREAQALGINLAFHLPGVVAVVVAETGSADGSPARIDYEAFATNSGILPAPG